MKKIRGLQYLLLNSIFFDAREGALMKSKQYGFLNKTQIMTTLVDMPTCTMDEQNFTKSYSQMKSYGKSLALERIIGFSSRDARSLIGYPAPSGHL